MDFRDQFELPLTDQQVEALEYLPLPKGGALETYLHEQRRQLGGYLPHRSTEAPVLKAPSLDQFHSMLDGSEREVFQYDDVRALVKCITKAR